MVEGGHAQLTRADPEPYAVDGEVSVPEDEAGNLTVALIAPFRQRAGNALRRERRTAPGGLSRRCRRHGAVGRRRTHRRCDRARPVGSRATPRRGGLFVALSLHRL
jgi:hypothetical protein